MRNKDISSHLFIYSTITIRGSDDSIVFNTIAHFLVRPKTIVFGRASVLLWFFFFFFAA